MRCLRHRVACMMIIGALSVGVACRGREAAREESPGGEMSASPTAVHFTPGGAPPRQLYRIEVVQDRIWLTTETDVIAIDPVRETWSVLNLGSRHPMQVEFIIACQSEVGLALRDTLVRVDTKTGQFQYSEVRGLLGPAAGKTGVACGDDGFWAYNPDGLFRPPTPGADTKRYRIPWPSQPFSIYGFAAVRGGAAYFVITGPGGPPGLFRFDTTTSRLDPIALPPGLFATGLEWRDQQLVIRAPDYRSFLLKSPGEQIEEILPTPAENLAAEQGVVWVGASYDVSPTSYFVLRYIKDVKEPRDLVILSGWGRPRLNAVSYLGMLWAISVDRMHLLRVDPSADELTRYAFTDSSGTLEKKSVHLIKEGDQLLFFDGDTLKKLELPPPPPAPRPAGDSSPPADFSEKAERQLLLDSDLLPVELEVLRRIWSLEHADELVLGPAVVPAQPKDLAKGKRRCHVLGKRVADELKPRNRGTVALPPS